MTMTPQDDFYNAQDLLTSAFIRVEDSYEEALHALEVIEARNAKLRELVRDALPFIAEEAGFCVADCFMYPACCEDTSDAECPAVARIHERAQELGVVNE